MPLSRHSKKCSKIGAIEGGTVRPVAAAIPKQNNCTIEHQEKLNNNKKFIYSTTVIPRYKSLLVLKKRGRNSNDDAN